MWIKIPQSCCYIVNCKIHFYFLPVFHILTQNVNMLYTETHKKLTKNVINQRDNTAKVVKKEIHRITFSPSKFNKNCISALLSTFSQSFAMHTCMKRKKKRRRKSRKAATELISFISFLFSSSSYFFFLMIVYYKDTYKMNQIIVVVHNIGCFKV